MRLHRTAVLVLFVVCSAFAFAQDEEGGSDLDFGLGIALGAQSFPNPDYVVDGIEPNTITYQSVSMTPDLALGKFGIGLDVALNYRFVDGAFEVRREDWIPDENINFLELYLPKLRYVRWGLKGDPLFVLLGQVDNGVLGNGFILGGYTNTQHLPGLRIFGMSLDVDGQLFNFPYVGLETFAGNLAAFDVIGSRLFVRPLIGTSIPIIKNLQIGGTVALDRDPFYFASKDPMGLAAIPTYLPADVTDYTTAQVLVYGADFRLPILSNPAISLAAFGDFVMQQENSGGMVGLGGRLFSVVPYGAQLRMLGADFIPVYFDGTYDLYRPEKYAVYSGVPEFSAESYIGWFASLGFALLEDQIMFNAALDGPFSGSDAGGTFERPHLLATFALAEGLLGGFSLDASYDKKDIDNFADLISGEETVFGARLNYRIENAVISLVYDLEYNPNAAPGDDRWIITSGLETAISLF